MKNYWRCWVQIPLAVSDIQTVEDGVKPGIQLTSPGMKEEETMVGGMEIGTEVKAGRCVGSRNSCQGNEKNVTDSQNTLKVELTAFVNELDTGVQRGSANHKRETKDGWGFCQKKWMGWWCHQWTRPSLKELHNEEGTGENDPWGLCLLDIFMETVSKQLDALLWTVRYSMLNSSSPTPPKVILNQTSPKWYRPPFDILKIVFVQTFHWASVFCLLLPCGKFWGLFTLYF